MRFEIEDGVLLKYNAPALGAALSPVVHVPEGVTAVGNGAFSGCEWLTKVIFPEPVTSIGNHAFRGCSRLTKVIVKDAPEKGLSLPEGLTAVGDYAFRYCGDLPSVTLPSTVHLIGAEAFAHCWSLTSISLPETAYCGDKVLYSCEMLRTITIRKPDGTEYHFPYERGIGRHYEVLPLLLNKDFTVHMPPEVLHHYLCRMAASGYDTEQAADHLLFRSLRTLVDWNQYTILQKLLTAERDAVPVSEKVCNDLIAYTNEKKQYDMQLLLMDAMHKYHKTPSDIMERLQL